ncbi:hypothetical protein AMELA_G00059270, partial [Ameiurus melas]
LLVLGDFNIHLDKPHAADFLALLHTFDLKQLTTPATHKAGKQLDLILTRNCTTHDLLISPLHTSDHFFIQFSISLPSPSSLSPPSISFRRNLRSLSPSHFSSIVTTLLPSNGHFSSLDVNTATDMLCSTLTSSLDSICPLTSRPARTSPSCPWLSEALRSNRAKLRASERKWRKSNNPIDLTNYQTLLSSFSKSISIAKTTYFQDKIGSSPNTRILFKTFSSLLCPPPPTSPSSLTADDFASFFSSKVTSIRNQFSTPDMHRPTPPPRTSQLTSFSPLSETDVSKLLRSSRPTTCPLDPIPSQLLQSIAPTLLPALTHIFNTSLSTGTYPTSFKQARVTPLLKKPSLNPSIVDNYRPVSLLPFLSKTLERAVFNQLHNFLTQNNLLDTKQSGFKSNHSTETALLSVTEALRLARATSRSSVLILLDLSAAFDTVNHQILLSTLSNLGINGTVLRWVESYLSDRSFKVSWSGA